MTIRSSAPVRLDFAGGWTDVAPFTDQERGAVVNAAIELRAEVTLQLGGEGFRLESLETGRSVEIPNMATLTLNGDLDLLKAAVRMYRPGPCRLQTRSDAPQGGGLGGSGALDVALVAALERGLGRFPSPAELAHRAWDLEARQLGIPGGKQDQFAAALGGFHHLTFSGNEVAAVPIALPAGFADHLAQSILLCYTGESRLSGRTIARVMSRYAAGNAEVVGALRGMVEVADLLVAGLEGGSLADVARLVQRNWSLQQDLDEGMCTPTMAALEQAMRDAGALGGKAAGSGAGGTMFFVFDTPARAAAARTTVQGVTYLPVSWAVEGVRVW
ncbi:MAG: hypothetical protein KF785_05365 [Gemmatimonadales bacterium]|nr:hypothetical protein [Gemmatimonadales bacterium]